MGLVADYTGLEPRGGSPAPRRSTAASGSRPTWALRRCRRARAPARGSLDLPGPLGSPARGHRGAPRSGSRSATRQRVLGQYDVALIGPSGRRACSSSPPTSPRRSAAGAEREPFLRWIALHEATHAVQFASVPWLRDHLGAMVEELLGAVAGPSRAGLRRGARLLTPDPRLAVARSARRVALLVAAARRRLLGRLQATMAVVEGYSEHVMDAVGAGRARPAARCATGSRAAATGAACSM